jgi:hypothetical protein
MELQQRRWLKRDRYSTEPIRHNPKRTESGDEPIQHAEIWGTPTGTIENQ